MVLVAKRRHVIAWGEVSEGERNPRIDSTIRRVAKRRHMLRSLIQNDGKWRRSWIVLFQRMPSRRDSRSQGHTVPRVAVAVATLPVAIPCRRFATPSHGLVAIR